jgi:excisionase family DNA binding protein
MKNMRASDSSSSSTSSSIPSPAPATAIAPSTSPFLTPQQLAARWQCSVVKLRRMRKAGVLPGHAMGSHVRFLLTDIEQLEAAWKTDVSVGGGAGASTAAPAQEAKAS